MIRWAENWIDCHNNKAVSRRCAFERQTDEALAHMAHSEKKLIWITLLNHFWDLNSRLLHSRKQSWQTRERVSWIWESRSPFDPLEYLLNLLLSYIHSEYRVSTTPSIAVYLYCCVKISSNLRTEGVGERVKRARFEANAKLFSGLPENSA